MTAWKATVQMNGGKTMDGAGVTKSYAGAVPATESLCHGISVIHVAIPGPIPGRP